MSHQRNVAIAQKLLQGIGSGQDPSEIAALFDADLVFEIQGDDGVLPWIGRKTGRQAVADFIRDIRALTESVSFEVEDILASESRAAIIGALQTRIKATGKIIATQFAIILTITGDVVTRFQMLEDSFDVSKAGPHLKMSFGAINQRRIMWHGTVRPEKRLGSVPSYLDD
jgi:ketosteroid isomerase-like protein